MRNERSVLDLINSPSQRKIMKSLKNKFFIGLAAVAMTAASGVYAQNSAPSASPATGNMSGMGMEHAQMEIGRASCRERV